MFKKTTFKRIGTAGLVGLISACSMIPAYHRPAAPVAAVWPGQDGAAPTGAATAAADVPWQHFFPDERLRQLIGAALANNRDLRVAALNIEQARAQLQIRQADQLPTVNAVLAGARQPVPSGVNGSRGLATTYSAGLGITAYEFDFFGRVASLKEQALAQYLATEEARRSAQIGLIAAVANTYLSLLADDELLSITHQTLATREESYRLSKLRFDNGVTSGLDLRQSESLAQAARVAQIQLQRQRALDLNAMTLLIGQPLSPQFSDLLLPGGKSLASAAVMQALPAGLPSDLLVHRPDLRQAEQQLVAANANIGAARANFFPRISLTTSVGSASSRLLDLFKSGSFAWTLAPQLLLPLFDAGRNEAGLGATTAGRDIAVAQYEKAIQTAFREVSDALAARATLGEQLAAQQAQAEAEAGRFKLADLRYQNGIASSLDALDAQRSLFTVQQALVQTRLANLQAQVTLYKALGGGWTEGQAASTGGPQVSGAAAVRRP